MHEYVLFFAWLLLGKEVKSKKRKVCLFKATHDYSLLK